MDVVARRGRQIGVADRRDCPGRHGREMSALPEREATEHVRQEAAECIGRARPRNVAMSEIANRDCRVAVSDVVK